VTGIEGETATAGLVALGLAPWVLLAKGRLQTPRTGQTVGDLGPADPVTAGGDVDPAPSLLAVPAGKEAVIHRRDRTTGQFTIRNPQGRTARRRARDCDRKTGIA
jgi:hypothetical protein